MDNFSFLLILITGIMYFNFTSVDRDGLIEVSDSSSMMLNVKKFNHVLDEIVPKIVGEVIEKGDINKETKLDNVEIVRKKKNYTVKGYLRNLEPNY